VIDVFIDDVSGMLNVCKIESGLNGSLLVSHAMHTAVSHLRDTSPAHVILLVLIIITIFAEGYIL
jgi:hypothetical protein